MRLTITIGVLALLAIPVRAQAPKLDDIVDRIGLYVSDYGVRLASVVAEETYHQQIPVRMAASLGKPARRTLRSDYALVRVDGRDSWVGYRDTFEVDGRPVRDHDVRLQQLITSGAILQASSIARQNASYNLASEFLQRNVNVPTFALDLLGDAYRDRFVAQRVGTDVIKGRVAWIVEFTERDRPTIVRTTRGGDQPSRVRVSADPSTGEVLQTTVDWKLIGGSITVQYGRVPDISVPVPLTMAEQYAGSDAVGIHGDATYSKYRHFETSGRLIVP